MLCDQMWILAPLCHFTAVQPQASGFASLSLDSLVCKVKRES